MLETWPGQMRTVYGDHQRFIDTYFTRFPGKYFSGDGCRRDEDGYYWITGRVDDVIIVSGHNLGTAEIEGAIGGHKAVAEAAVVGYPHDIKGNAIYAFVTLKTGEEITETLNNEIVKQVRADIGPHASPEKIQFTKEDLAELTNTPEVQAEESQNEDVSLDEISEEENNEATSEESETSNS